MKHKDIISVRVSRQDTRILNFLMKKWGENRTRAIKRALQIALQQEARK